MSELKTNLEQILQEKTTKLIPENIKRKVEIFDVIGTDGDAEVEELQAKIIETRQEIADTRRDLENSAAIVTGTGENVTLNQTAEATLKKLDIGGNTKQASYEGYNLININNQVNRTDSGVEIIADAEKQTIKFNGTIDNTYCTSAKLALSEPLSTGVFRANFNSKCDTFIVFRASDDTWLKSIQSSNNSAIDISTLSKPVTHIQFGIEHLTSGTNVNYEVGYQLTEGNELKPYEPYVGETASPNPDYPQEITNVTGDVEVVVGNKNLWSANLPIIRIDESSTITANNNGGIDITLASSAILGYVFYDLGNIKKYKNKTITLSIGNSANALYKWCAFINCDSNGNNRTELAYFGTNNNKLTLTIGDSYNQSNLAVRLYIMDGTPNTTYPINNIQVELSSTATNWVAHQQQTFTFPLGNEKLMLGDYLADDGIHRVKGQVVLDGTESWSNLEYISGDDNFRVQKVEALPNILTPPTNPANLICNYFKAVNRDDAYIKSVVGIAQYGLALGTIFISAPISVLETQDMQGWKNWLSTHNLIVEYELAEETITPYTSAQQEVYNEMKKAISYEEQTNISSPDEVSPIFTVTAFRDADLAIASLDNQLTLKE